MTRALPWWQRLAGIEITAAEGGALVVQPTTASLALAGRWQRVVDALQRGEGPASPAARALLSLVARDAVVTREALEAIASSGQLWHDDTDVYLEWVRAQGAWQDRRLLNPATAALLSNGMPGTQRAHWLAAARWAAPRIESARVSMDEVLAAAAAWWTDRLPPALALHVLGVRSFQLLPRSAHARRVRRVDLQGVEANDAAVELDRITVWLDEAGPATDRKAGLQSVVVAVRSTAATHARHATFRRALLDRIVTLMPRVCEDGPAQALVVAGLYSVVAEGGVRGRLLGRRTLLAYTRSTLMPLAAALMSKGDDPVAWDAQAWLQTYESVLAPLAGTERIKARAFLLAWHRFVVARGGAPLRGEILGTDGESVPYARVAWAHECTEARDFIHRAPVDDELRLFAIAALLGMVTRALRPSELATARVGEVIEHGHGGVSLSLSPMARDGVGKSPAMRQRQEVICRDTAAALLDLKRHRRLQHAPDDHHLWGSPRSPGRPWRWAETLRLVTAALREATGDPTVTPYALRHAVVSMAMSSAWMPGRPIDDALEPAAVSSHAGHGQLESSRPYCNLIEVPLAAWARRAVPADSKAAVEGLPHVAAGLPERQPLGTALGSAAPPVQGPAPAGLGGQLSVADVIKVLLDHGRDIPVSVIARRWSLSEDRVRAVVRRVGKLLLRAGLLHCSKARNDDQILSAAKLFAPWFAAATEARWSSVAQHLQSLDLVAARACVDALVDCAHPRSLSIDSPLLAQPLVHELLTAAKNDPRIEILIRTCEQRPDSTVQRWVADGARVETCRHRRGDPRTRLLVTTRRAEVRKGAGGSGRRDSNHGLFGLLLALDARLDRHD